VSYSQRKVLNLCSLLSVLIFVPVFAQAQSDVAREKFLTRANNRPLVSLKATADKSRGKPVVSRPAREVPNYRGNGKPVFGGGTASSDAILQDSVGEQIAMVGSGFYGASNEDNAAVVGFMIAPPDTDGQVGPDHYVQMINLLTTIFAKNGDVIVAPFESNVLWTGIGGNCEAYNQGDPIVLYDDVDDRWLVSQFAFPDSMSTYSQCVAVSVDGDPTGGWNRYEFSFDGIGLNDYPKHGIVSDSITMTANIFTPRGRNFNWGGTFLGVMDKAAMYAGQPASLIGFNIGSAEFGFVAGDLDGGGGPVPALFATAMSTVDHFDIWKVEVDWSTENATRSRIASIPITPFDSELCTASRGACIPQPENGPLLESLSDRLMHRLQIRYFPSHRSMVTAHTVDVGGGRAGIRWYELRETDGTNWELYQEGTFGPADGEHRFMPSAAMNAAGDIGIGYLLSSTNTYVSTAVVGQTASASGSGILDSEELICAQGTGVQEDVARSGDYSSTSVDPVDDSFWHTNEVFTDTGSFLWNTFICEFVVADSGGNTAPTASFNYSCDELTCTFTDQSNDPDGSVVAWNWGFGDGDTSMEQSPSHTFAGTGTYDVTLLVTDDDGATDSDTQPVSVTGPVENEPPTASFTYNCTDLSCSFDGGASTDTDGTITSYDWIFGDGGVGSGSTPDYVYAGDGDYNVTLTVTDNDGATDAVSQTVSVTGPVNNPPIASFSYDCTDLTCDFDGGASSDDGSITAYDWNFGDGNVASGPIPSHSYDSGNTYSVTLTVTDDLGATDSDNQLVSVSTTTCVPSLSGVGVMIKNRWTATVTDSANCGDLQGSWSESGSPDCDGPVCWLSNIHKRILSVTFTADGSGALVTVPQN